jgi:hypothetical protein
MASRRSIRPLNSYLLRVAEVRIERIELAFELVGLRDGSVHRFASLAALRRFLIGQQGRPTEPIPARRRK